MSHSKFADHIRLAGCALVLRRHQGPKATELFIHCQPLLEAGPHAAAQSKAVYEALAQVLAAEGGSLANVVNEMRFMRDPAAQVAAIHAAREQMQAELQGPPRTVAVTDIAQPPLAEHACFELLLQAVVPVDAALQKHRIAPAGACNCTQCQSAYGLRTELGGETRIYAGGIHGSGDGAYQQTVAMFEAAERMLQDAGMQFSEVTRTWIHLREMQRDYDAFNRGRRTFFESRGISAVPASTGIGGGPAAPDHDLELAILAVQSEPAPARTAMTSPTLNEAPQYGADFVRGLKVLETNRIALHISGTASVDEAGRTAHVGDFDAQADRMLANIAALLDGQQAGFGDIVSAITYVKHPQDAAHLREKFRKAGFEGFPHAVLQAEVCRDDLLVETEALALLPV